MKGTRSNIKAIGTHRLNLRLISKTTCATNNAEYSLLETRPTQLTPEPLFERISTFSGKIDNILGLHT
ncbi:hypothetical protein DSUL_20533 [Desulfovibrionales bacterium]